MPLCRFILGHWDRVFGTRAGHPVNRCGLTSYKRPEAISCKSLCGKGY
jgi:hypothetical protein